MGAFANSSFLRSASPAGSNQYTGAFGGTPSAPMPGNTPNMTPNMSSATPNLGGMWGAQPPMAYPGLYGAPSPESPMYNPYQVPGVSGNYNYGAIHGGQSQPGNLSQQQTDYSRNIGHGIIATGLQYPGLSQDFVNYLEGQIGAGMSPFDLMTMLPTGGMTQPGQLSAGLNPLLGDLSNFFMGGSSSVPGLGNLSNLANYGVNIPGMPGYGAVSGVAGSNINSLPGYNTLNTIANQGISALPEWQSMIGAQQQNIQQNQANLKEQFGSMGDLAGSPFGTAMSNYMQQTTKDQNALLGQLQQQNILQGQLPALNNLMGMGLNNRGLNLSAGSSLMGSGMEGLLQGQFPAMESLFSGAQTMGGGLQSLDQQAIQNMYQEFQRVQPQNNPMLQYMMGMSTLYPPTTKTPTSYDQFLGTLSALSGTGFSTSSGPSGSSTSMTF